MRAEFGAPTSPQYSVQSMAGHTERSHLLSGSHQARNYNAAGFHSASRLDAVARTVQRLADAWTYTIMLWMLGFVLAMLKFLDAAFSYDWVIVFVAVWLGTVVGFISTIVAVYRLFGRKITSREERMFLRVRGAEADYENSVDADSIPLFRRIVLWGGSVAACLGFIGASQVLLYLSLVQESVRLWTAVLPLFLLLAVVLIYLSFTKGIQPLTVVLVALVGLSVGLFTEHLRDPSAMSWTALLVPLWIVEAVAAMQAAYIFFQSCVGRYALERVQLVSLQIYVVALVLAVIAQMYTVAGEHSAIRNSLCWSPDHCMVAPIFMWTFAVVLFMVAFTCSFRWQLQQIAEQQGYTEPMPLSRTYQGWEPVGAKSSWWMLLGGVTVLSPDHHQQARQPVITPRGGTWYQTAEGPVHHLPPALLTSRAVESKDVELTTHTFTKRFSGELNDNYQDF